MAEMPFIPKCNKENYMASSTSSEITSTPFDSSLDRNWVETSSIAEFSCDIFSASTFLVFYKKEDYS